MKNKKEQFNKVYEGTNLNCLVNNLKYDTNYEFRICSIYNDIISPWTNIYKIKTLDFDSIILKEEKRKNEFIQKILEWSGYKKMELI